MTNGKDKIPPTATAVIISFAIVAVVLILGGSIAGSFLLMVHYVHTFTMHQMQEQIKSATSTCKWIKAMNDAGARSLPVHNFRGRTSYGYQLAQAIHGLYVHSSCPQILSGHYHPPQ